MIKQGFAAAPTYRLVGGALRFQIGSKTAPSRIGRAALTSLTIKNIPPDLFETLRRCAADHHRSINSEAIAQIKRSLAHTRIETGEASAKGDAIPGGRP
jgi:plasmid stability protein